MIINNIKHWLDNFKRMKMNLDLVKLNIKIKLLVMINSCRNMIHLTNQLKTTEMILISIFRIFTLKTKTNTNMMVITIILKLTIINNFTINCHKLKIKVHKINTIFSKIAINLNMTINLCRKLLITFMTEIKFLMIPIKINKIKNLFN